MYLTATEVHKKYGITPAHCHRDLVEVGHCRTKKYTFCGRVCTSYYEPDIIAIVRQRKDRKTRAEQRYAKRPSKMLRKESVYCKTIPKRMYKKLRNAWFGMMRRCYTTDRPDYHHYREAEISICEDWLNDFDSFASWSLEHGVDYSLSLDRKDNNLGYSPENCRWVDKRTQGNNTSVNALFAYNGMTKTVSEWADEFNIPYNRLWSRLNEGWPIEKALFSKRNYGKKKNSLLLSYDGETKSLADWAREKDLPYYIVLTRFKKGWPPEKVLSQRDFRGKR